MGQNIKRPSPLRHTSFPTVPLFNAEEEEPQMQLGFHHVTGGVLCFNDPLWWGKLWILRKPSLASTKPVLPLLRSAGNIPGGATRQLQQPLTKQRSWKEATPPPGLLCCRAHPRRERAPVPECYRDIATASLLDSAQKWGGEKRQGLTWPQHTSCRCDTHRGLQSEWGKEASRHRPHEKQDTGMTQETALALRQTGKTSKILPGVRPHGRPDVGWGGRFCCSTAQAPLQGRGLLTKERFRGQPVEKAPAARAKGGARQALWPP